MEGHTYKIEKKEIKPAFDETPIEHYGVSIRCMEYLFQLIEHFSIVPDPDTGQPSTKSFVVRCSFCQIYNENVYDLLSESPRTGSLKIRWDSNQDFFVENLLCFECFSANDAIRLFRQGISRRVVASHKMNSASSRSHCMFTIQVEQVDATLPQDKMVSKLVLVDLAGSERVAHTGATGSVLNQSIGINKSLFTLRKVIAALAQQTSEAGKTPAKGLNNQQHIPYRDSTLTRLLKPCLGGNSLTLMIACIAPSDTYAEV